MSHKSSIRVCLLLIIVVDSFLLQRVLQFLDSGLMDLVLGLQLLHLNLLSLHECMHFTHHINCIQLSWLG